MKRSLKKLLEFKVYTQDEKKGDIKDFLFDEETWIIRYVEADQGKILPSKKVLVPRVFLGDPDWDNEKFNIKMTKEGLEKCPPTDDHKPVSRKYEEKLADHLKMEHYWGSIAPPVTGYPGYPPRPIEVPKNQIKEENIETNLRSFSEILGYKVHTAESPYGVVEDIIIDEEDWQVLYIITNSEYTDATREVMIGINWINEISYEDQKITLQVTDDTISMAPDFAPAQPINITYEKKVQDYYGRNIKDLK